MTNRFRLTLLLALSALLSLSARAAEFERIGTFDFPSSASGQVQEHFLRGVGYLHSFGMTQANAEPIDLGHVVLLFSILEVRQRFIECGHHFFWSRLSW